MAVIAVKIAGIQGDCTINQHVNEIDAVSIRETIEVGVPQNAGAGSVGGGGTGKARFSDIELTRFKDRASPKLAQACSGSENLGHVEIALFQTVGEGVVKYMTYELIETVVARIEQETLDQNEVAFQPHFSVSRRGAPLPPSASGLPSLMAPLLAAQSAAVRMAPRPIYSMQRGPADDREVERVWLNYTKVSWTYHIYKKGKLLGSVSNGFDIGDGKSRGSDRKQGKTGRVS